MSSVNHSNALRINLRRDQTISEMSKFNDSNVTIFGPLWLQHGLEQLAKHTPPDIVLEVMDNKGSKLIELDSFGLKALQMIARNERCNTSGEIAFSLYENVIKDRSVIYSIKDLVRQSVIIGLDETTHFGGYGTRKSAQVSQIILIDLIGLQFQKPYNSGRLVLIGPNEYVGLLDDFILENVTGQKRVSFEQIKSDRTGRFKKCGDAYFDTYAYEKFVEQDFILVCLALQDTLGPAANEINLKFLKYGTGFFAGLYARILEQHISKGIYAAMKQLLESGRNQIKSFEFPFYQSDQHTKQLSKLCKKHSVECRLTKYDALQQTHLKTATTNCADPHAVAGNEMGYSSVDAAIAENIKSKAKKFSPIINTEMKEKFININLKPAKL